MMKLYHGSTVLIDKIELEKSKPYKDYGRAFYLSAENEQAIEMAKLKSVIYGLPPIVTEYEFEESVLNSASQEDLKVKVFPHYSLEWAEFVWNNRDEKQNFQHDFDIVYGPIANDTIGYQMSRYREEHGDLRTFLEGLKYKKGETFQFAFCTEKSLKYLKKV